MSTEVFRFDTDRDYREWLAKAQETQDVRVDSVTPYAAWILVTATLTPRKLRKV